MIIEIYQGNNKETKVFEMSFAGDGTLSHKFVKALLDLIKKYDKKQKEVTDKETSVSV